MNRHPCTQCAARARLIGGLGVVLMGHAIHGAELAKTRARADRYRALLYGPTEPPAPREDEPPTVAPLPRYARAFSAWAKGQGVPLPESLASRAEAFAWFVVAKRVHATRTREQLAAQEAALEAVDKMHAAGDEADRWFEIAISLAHEVATLPSVAVEERAHLDRAIELGLQDFSHDDENPF
jgi:hypothetical protein